MNWSWLRRKKPGAALTPDLRRRIRASFEDAAADEEHFPSTIDERILFVRVILDHIGPLGRGRALDAGCGKGRFARIVAARNPGAEIWGLDIALAMLRAAPHTMQPCAGSLTELPFRDAAFDAAYAVESLEHAVEVDRAVEELCRVVRPGGRIAIIDKNSRKWGALPTPEWEKWFGRKELERLLRRRCRRVESRLLSYWDDVPPDGLFLAWLAEK